MLLSVVLSLLSVSAYVVFPAFDLISCSFSFSIIFKLLFWLTLFLLFFFHPSFFSFVYFYLPVAFLFNHFDILTFTSITSTLPLSLSSLLINVLFSFSYPYFFILVLTAINFATVITSFGYVNSFNTMHFYFNYEN